LKDERKAEIEKHRNIFDAIFDKIDVLTKRLDSREVSVDGKLDHLELESECFHDKQDQMKKDFKSLERYQARLQQDLLGMEQRIELF